MVNTSNLTRRHSSTVLGPSTVCEFLASTLNTLDFQDLAGWWITSPSSWPWWKLGKGNHAFYPHCIFTLFYAVFSKVRRPALHFSWNFALTAV